VIQPPPTYRLEAVHAAILSDQTEGAFQAVIAPSIQRSCKARDGHLQPLCRVSFFRLAWPSIASLILTTVKPARKSDFVVISLRKVPFITETYHSWCFLPHPLQKPSQPFIFGVFRGFSGFFALSQFICGSSPAAKRLHLPSPWAARSHMGLRSAGISRRVRGGQTGYRRKADTPTEAGTPCPATTRDPATAHDSRPSWPCPTRFLEKPKMVSLGQILGLASCSLVSWV